MQQRINFYSHVDKIEKDWWDFSRLGQLCGASLLAVVLLWVFALYERHESDAALQLAIANEQKLAEELTALQQEKKSSGSEDSLLSQIRNLQSDIKIKRDIVSRVSGDPKQVPIKFSDYLQGLGQQHIDGLWFKRIQLLHGGDKLALSGYTQKPEYLPQYLQKLADEEAFVGHQFSVFRMSLSEDKALLDFEVRSEEAVVTQ